MKNIKFIMILLAVACLFLCLGIFWGKSQHDGDFSVSVEMKSTDSGKVDINSAPVYTLCLLPGISDAMAQKIVDHREQYGPFDSIYELLDIAGISDTTLNKFKDYICVNR